jgi:hypothetical protein
MTGLFGRLAERALGLAPLLAPRLPTRYEAVTDWADLPEALGESAAPELLPDQPGDAAWPQSFGSQAGVPTTPAARARAALGADAPRSSAVGRSGTTAPRSAWIGGTAGIAAPSPEASSSAMPEAGRAPPLLPSPVHRASAAPGAVARHSAAVPTRIARVATEAGAVSPSPSDAALGQAVMHGDAAAASGLPEGSSPAPAVAEPGLPPRGAVGTTRSEPATLNPAAVPERPLPAAVAAGSAEITIGRVEIRFAAPAPRPAAKAAAVGPPPLEALLARERR